MPAVTPSCVIGIGNPGADYANTRHNAGLWLLQQLVDSSGAVLKSSSKLYGAHCKVQLGTTTVLCCVSHTYMNESGRAVQALASFFKLQPAQLLIVHDEMDLPAGEARIKYGGGLAGHNGLRDIVQSLGGERDFWRLRIGVSRPAHSSAGKRHVLRKPSAQEMVHIQNGIDRSLQVLPLLCGGNAEGAQQQLHTRVNDGE